MHVSVKCVSSGGGGVGQGGGKGEEHLIAAHICVSSWALGAPVQPISPHQTHSLGLSVNTNTNTKGSMREGPIQAHIRQSQK